MKIEEKSKNIIIAIIVLIMCGIIFMYQTQKVGFHEDEGHTLASSVNPKNGLMTAYEYIDLFTTGNRPVWKTREFVTDYVTLSPENYFNLAAIYMNQALDNHPPVFYTLVHFSSLIFFLGHFSKYAVFIVNITAFAISCVVLKKILKLLNKENLTIGILIFYGLSMGTISMVIFQKMYTLLNLFIILYFYYSLKIYKNDFELDKKMIIRVRCYNNIRLFNTIFFHIICWSSIYNNVD